MKFLFAFILTLSIVPVTAQAQYILKDSAYYTMDDGIQTPEEMRAESMHLYDYCKQNTYQATYFNCECLAGEFLTEREKRGPTIPQYTIMEDLTKTPKAKCANTEVIAGMIYEDCMKYSSYMRELETDNEDYCTCAANKTARDFTRTPRLSVRYIRHVRKDALAFCREPSGRTQYLSSKPKTENWLSSSPTP